MKSFLIPLIVLSMLSLLLAVSKTPPSKDDDGNAILKLPSFYFILGILVFFSGFGLIYYLIFFAQSTEVIAVVISSIFIFILGTLLFMKGYIFNITLLDKGIVEKTMFGKIKIINWNQIESISFGKTSLELKIKSSNTKIKAHMHLKGFSYLIQKIEENTNYSRVEMGLPDH